jgi:ribulose-phosphate 3-epimerase
MIDVIPGILEKEWSAIYKKIRLVAPFVEWVQVDVADNTLVPNTTILDFSLFRQIAADCPAVSLEGHLMVTNPEKYIKPMVDAGFKRLIAHVECHDPRIFLEQAQYEDIETGIAIDGSTEIEQVEPYLDQVDVVLVMTIEAGFSGQPFLPETLEKIRKIHEHYPDLVIEVDGGINDKTAKPVKEAGATRLVSTSYLFKNPDTIALHIENLKKV